MNWTQRARAAGTVLRTLGTAADARSAASLAAMYAGRRRGETTVRLRALEHQAITLRPFPETVDLRVLADTFVFRHHAVDLAAPRRILDLGANIGLTMAHYAELFPDAEIVGLELDAGNAALARKNTSTFGDRCRVLHAAVWIENGPVNYDPSLEQWGYHVGSGAASATAVTMDHLLEELDWERVDFAKMDIEGAERHILSAPGAWVDRVARLQVETHNGYTVDQCVRDLRALGFDAAGDRRHRRHWMVVSAHRDVGASDQAAANG